MLIKQPFVYNCQWWNFQQGENVLIRRSILLSQEFFCWDLELAFLFIHLLRTDGASLFETSEYFTQHCSSGRLAFKWSSQAGFCSSLLQMQHLSMVLVKDLVGRL